ncbi:MAG: serine/threonine-protein kinase [Myxococcota bacterium]
MVRVLSDGDTVGGVQLVRRIALGGMAEIWQGLDGGESVAVKVMLDTFARDPVLVGMFRDEASIAERIQHPNVVRVYRHFEEDGHLGQVMELVDGRDLRRVLQAAIKNKLTVPTPLALYVGRSVAAGLAHAHQLLGSDGRPLEVVHRDVTPHNVIIDRKGGVRVLDFGVARARERITRTQAGVIKGKIAYMSPEQILGKEVSLRTDIFALGVVLWETLALRRLFFGTDAEIVNQIVSGEVAPLEDLLDIEPEVSALVDRMLAVEAEARPASMTEIVEAIDAIVARLWTGGESSAAVMAAWIAPFLDPVKRSTARLPSDRPERPSDPISEARTATEPMPAASAPTAPARVPTEEVSLGPPTLPTPTPAAAPAEPEAFADRTPPLADLEQQQALQAAPLRLDSLARTLPRPGLDPAPAPPPAPPKAGRPWALLALALVGLAAGALLLWSALERG